MKEKNYKFSVIIPIYNVEDYLEEAILSVIHQTLDFRENIQMILVNDGSVDNSGEICERYQQQYPENIIYLSQENAGVSAARNHGLSMATGNYINFLDADDKWSENAFQRVEEFFLKYGEQVDLVACRLHYFEAKNSYHVLDYKFKETRVIDTKEDYNYTQMHIASSFIKKEAIFGKSFDETLKYAEDAKLANEIILEKEAYGIVQEAEYMYRARLDDSSAMDRMHGRNIWYTPTIQGFHHYMLAFSKQRFKEVPKYVQYMLMYDLKWRLKLRLQEDVLSEEEKKEYLEAIRQVLQDIDDEIVLEQNAFGASLKYKTLELKYSQEENTSVLDKIEFREDGAFYIGDKLLTNYRRVKTTVVHFISVKADTIELMGKCSYWMPKEEWSLFFVNKNEKNSEKTKYYPEFFEVHNNVKYGLEGAYEKLRGFKVTIPYHKKARIGAFFQYHGTQTYEITLGFGKFMGLNMFKNSYMVADKKYLVRRRGMGFQIMQKTPELYKEFERNYCKELKEFGHKDILKFRYIKRYMENRKRAKGKKIWLISDRMNIARDNGEAFFTYLCENRDKVPNVDFYFVLSKGCQDYERMSKIGKVVDPHSFRYKCLFLAADWIISAHADEYVINAFGKDRQYLKNIYDFKYAFLQHGITKDDISGWLNRYNKDIDLFVTAAKKEYDSILNGDYFYDETVVKHTGFPRHDKLRNTKERKKSIIFLPTWRNGLVGALDLKTGEREYNPEYKNSSFCQFYNRLLQDERIIKAMKTNGYVGKFCLHTNNMQQIQDFTGNEVILINEEPLDYTKEFLENALMITDYSSVAFDFAYTKKPVIYVQVDREEFFAGQVYEPGYFSYDNDGFGPVCYDYEQTVAAIIKAIENDCRMEEKYLNRVENFFGDLGESNCENVLNEILKS